MDSDAINEGVKIISNNFSTVGEMVSNLGENSVEVVDSLSKFSSDALNSAGEVLIKAKNLGGDALKGASNLGGDALNGVSNALNGSAFNDISNVSGDALKGASNLGGDALTGVSNSLNGSTFNDISNVSGDALNGVINLGGNLAKTAGGINSSVVEGFNSPEFQNMMKNGFGALDDAYNVDMTQAKKTMLALAGIGTKGCFDLLPLLRFEIFRDFFQVLSLFFANVYAHAKGVLKSAKSLFGGISNFVAIDFGNVFYSQDFIRISISIVIVLGVLLIFSFIKVVLISLEFNTITGDSVRSGHEAREFKDVAAEKKKSVKFVGIIVTVALSLYLPISQYSFQVLFCKSDQYILNFKDFGLCSSDNENKFYANLVAVIFICVFTISLPIFLHLQINLSKPTGSPENPLVTYNIDGDEVPFDDKIYTDIIENDLSQKINPFRSLYQGFER
jgi:hypothetical protein